LKTDKVIFSLGFLFIYNMISTKIIATIGPASDSVKTIEKMYDAGMRVARLNFSHGDYDYFTKIINNVRKVSTEIAIMLDTKGPEIRSGDVKNGMIELCDEDKLILTTRKVIGTNKLLTINYIDLAKLKKGDLVLIDDGLIECQVLSPSKEGVKVKVLNGGGLGSNKTCSLKGHSPNLAFLSKKDIADINFAIVNDFDYIAASFVRSVDDVKSIYKLLDKKKSKIRVISKIEHWEAIDNLDELCDISQGIMVARGDLGVEIPMEQIPRVQKDLIHRCNELGKPVIVATQMLESMKDNPRPTRAEISDVAQAILDGTDAIMLSGETAGGKYPVKAVRMMATIAKEYEHHNNVSIMNTLHPEDEIVNNSISLFITKSAAIASKELPNSIIITPTESGYSARKVSRFKPKVPILAMTRDMTTLRQLNLSWGVRPFMALKKYENVDEMMYQVVKYCDKNKLLKGYKKAIITSGHNFVKGHTNKLEIYDIDKILKALKSKK
jgi:pyruvate kinase